MEVAGLTTKLITEVGVYATVAIILVVAVAFLCKHMLKIYAQNREDSLKREAELIKCFDNISAPLRDINTTMRDTNIRLTMLESQHKRIIEELRRD